MILSACHFSHLIREIDVVSGCYSIWTSLPAVSAPTILVCSTLVWRGASNPGPSFQALRCMSHWHGSRKYLLGLCSGGL